MFCTKCGQQNDDNVSFCTNCGAPLNSEENTNPQAQPVQPEVQPPQQPQYQAQAPQSQPNAPVPGKGLGIASMVLGIVSLALFCFLYIAIPCAVVGIILGIVGYNQAKKVNAPKGMATAGIVCSAIALGILVIALILTLIGVIGAASYTNNFSDFSQFGNYNY